MQRKLICLFLILLLCMAGAGCRKEKDPSEPIDQTTANEDVSNPVESSEKTSADITNESQTTTAPSSEADGSSASDNSETTNATDSEGMQILDNYEIEIDDNQGVGSL